MKRTIRPVRTLAGIAAGSTVIALLIAGPAHAAGGYQLTGMANAPADHVTATAISGAGRVLVYGPDGRDGQQALIWDPSTQQATTLAQLNTDPEQVGKISQPEAINAAGDVVGASGVEEDLLPVVWHDATPTALLSPSYQGSATAINDSGVIVGTAYDFHDGYDRNQPAVWQGGTTTFLSVLSTDPGQWDGFATDINSGGVVVGHATGTDYATYPVRWVNGVLSRIGTQPGTALKINDHNTVLLSVSGQYGLWRAGTFTAFAPLADGSSFVPTDLNDKGQVVGYVTTTTDKSRAVLRQANGHYVRLPNYLNQSRASSINDSGVIAGTSWSSNGALSRPVVWQKPVAQAS